jgi:hypothetical protein
MALKCRQGTRKMSTALLTLPLFSTLGASELRRGNGRRQEGRRGGGMDGTLAGGPPLAFNYLASGAASIRGVEDVPLGDWACPKDF